MTTKEAFPKEIVLVAGERVALTPTGLPPGDPMGVDFDTYYKADGLSPSDITLVKATFQELFGGTSLPVFDSELQQDLDVLTNQAFLPPCDPSQKALVLKTLEFRMAKLRQEMGIKGILSAKDIAKKLSKESSIGSTDPRDTAALRDIFRHYQKLKALIDNYNEGQKCVSMSDTAFGNLQFDLTDDRAKELLRQFIFFTLQAHHPLQDYKKTNPTAPQFIKRLEVNPLGDKFKTFLTTYEGNKLPIPESIARVLESIEAKSGILDEQLKLRLAEAIQTEKDRIIKLILTVFPGDHRFWATVGKDKDLYKMVDTLLEYIKLADGEQEQLTKENAALAAKLRRCEENSKLVTANYSRIEAQVNDLQGRLAAEGTKDQTIKDLQGALDKAKADHAARLQENATQIQELTARIATNEETIARITNENTALRGRVQELEQQVAALRDIEQRKDAEIARLAAEHTAALAAAEGRVAQEAQARQAAETQRLQAQRELEAGRVELTGQRAALEAKDQELVTLRGEVDRVTREKAECDTETGTLRTQLADANRELETLRGEKAQFQQQIEAKEEEIQRLTAEPEADEEEIERLNEQIRELQAQLADLQTRLNACEAARIVLQRDADEPRQKAEQLAAQLATATTQLAAAEQEKQRLTTENQTLQDELQGKDITIQERSQELREAKAEAEEKTGGLTTAKARISSLQDEVGTLQRQVQIKSDEVAAEAAGRRQDAATHESKIEELTNEYRGLIDAKTQELGEMTQQADAERTAKVAETEKLRIAKEAYEKLQAAIEVLLTGTQEEADASRAALDTEGNEQTKTTLESVYRKLKEAETLQSAPTTPTEEAAQKKLSQCYNVFLLTYLWQLNFPPGNEESQAFLTKIKGIYSGLPTITGVYKATPTGTVLDYLNLVSKLLKLYDGDTSRVELVGNEPQYFNLIVRVLDPISRTIGKPFVQYAKEYFTSHQPKAPPFDSNVVLRGSTVELDASGPLNFPILYYSFLVVMRDYLNTITGSLGRCPLPRILQETPPRRGSYLQTLD